jgi:hypothetical protein
MDVEVRSQPAFLNEREVVMVWLNTRKLPLQANTPRNQFTVQCCVSFHGSGIHMSFIKIISLEVHVVNPCEHHVQAYRPEEKAV